MKKYILKKENLKKQLNLFVIEDISTFNEHYKNSMQILIDYFNKEYKWDGMFNLNDVEMRLKSAEKLFLLYYNDIVLGYVFFKHIDNKTCFGYNLYVTKIVDRPKHSAMWFYSEASKYMLNEYEFIKVEIEDWNNVVFDIVQNIGYEKYI